MRTKPLTTDDDENNKDDDDDDDLDENDDDNYDDVRIIIKMVTFSKTMVESTLTLI